MIKKDGNVMTNLVFKKNGYVIRIISVKMIILTKKMAVTCIQVGIIRNRLSHGLFNTSIS